MNITSNCDLCYVDNVEYKGKTKPYFVKNTGKTHRLCPTHFDLTQETLGDPTVAKVGRNDPCPCGIRKKYKKCCGS